jgi:hypothetical protein
MNTLSDLRRTLDQHAGDVVDPAAVARSAAVHHRVSVVRRRRGAVGAGALALVVGVGVVTAVWPHHSQGGAAPAAPIVLGQRAPETIGSLGYTYRTDGHGEAFGRTGSIKVSESTKPQLYSWTTEGADTVRVTLPDGDVVHSTETGFHDFAVVAPGDSGKLRVAVTSGQVGLASYALTDAAPAGYTKGGVTYRDQVAGVPLLTARIGDLGQTVVRTSFVSPGGSLSVPDMCSGLPKGDVVNVSINHDGRVVGDCDSLGVFDPGSSGGGMLGVGHEGRRVQMRVWVSAGYRSPAPLPASSLPSFRLGAAVYGPVPQRSVAGNTVPIVVEHGGHTWRLRSVHQSDGAPIRLPAAPYDRIAAMAWSTHGSTEVTFGADSSKSPEGGNFSGGRAGLPDLWAPAGSPVQASLDHGTGRFGVALYERTD